MNFEGRLLKKHVKFATKIDKKRCKFTIRKNQQKTAQKSDLGRFWAPFGRGLGWSGPSFGHFWASFGRFFGVQNSTFLKHWSKMGSKRPFGWILGRFGRVLGRFGKDLGRNLEGFGTF